MTQVVFAKQPTIKQSNTTTPALHPNQPNQKARVVIAKRSIELHLRQALAIATAILALVVLHQLFSVPLGVQPLFGHVDVKFIITTHRTNDTISKPGATQAPALPTNCDPKTHRCARARPVQSAASGRRFLAGVVSANVSSARTTKFLRRWQSAWPGIEITVQRSFCNAVEVRGYGALVSQFLLLDDALNRDPDSFDYLLIFEDDAMPFDNVTWPNQAPNDFDARLDMLENRDGDLLLLGAHSMRNQWPGEHKWYPPYVPYVEVELPVGIYSLQFSSGAYAWVLRSRFLPQMHRALEESIANKNSSEGVADEVWWPVLKDHSAGGGFVSVPLLVDHLPGFSATWKTNRTKVQKFEGHRDWWNYPRNW